MNIWMNFPNTQHTTQVWFISKAIWLKLFQRINFLWYNSNWASSCNHLTWTKCNSKSRHYNWKSCINGVLKISVLMKWDFEWVSESIDSDYMKVSNCYNFFVWFKSMIIHLQWMALRIQWCLQAQTYNYHTHTHEMVQVRASPCVQCGSSLLVVFFNPIIICSANSFI